VLAKPSGCTVPVGMSRMHRMRTPVAGPGCAEQRPRHDPPSRLSKLAYQLPEILRRRHRHQPWDGGEGCRRPADRSRRIEPLPELSNAQARSQVKRCQKDGEGPVAQADRSEHKMTCSGGRLGRGERSRSAI
jgi:hypothetical protein